MKQRKGILTDYTGSMVRSTKNSIGGAWIQYSMEGQNSRYRRIGDTMT
jgi:hypothetical protein